MDIQLVKGGLLSATICLFGVFEMQISATRSWQHPVRNMTGSDNEIPDGLDYTLPEVPQGPGLKNDSKTKCPGGMFSLKNGKCHNCSTYCPSFMYISTPCSADTDIQCSYNLEEMEVWDRNETNATPLICFDRDALYRNMAAKESILALVYKVFGINIATVLFCFCLLILIFCIKLKSTKYWNKICFCRNKKDTEDTGVIFAREAKAEYLPLQVKTKEFEVKITDPKQDMSLSCSDISSDWSMQETPQYHREQSGSIVVEMNPLLEQEKVVLTKSNPFSNTRDKHCLSGRMPSVRSAPMLKTDFAKDPAFDESKSVMEAGVSAAHISQPRKSLLQNHLRANSKSGSQESSPSLSSETYIKHPPDYNFGQSLIKPSVYNNHIPFDKGPTRDGRYQRNFPNIHADSSDSESLSYSMFYIGSSQQCLTRLNQHEGTPILDKKLQYNYNSSRTPSSGSSIADDPGLEVTERTGFFSLI